MWDSAFCGAGINIPPVIVEMKNLMKDLKGLLGEFRGWPTVELFSVRLAGLSAEDRERHLLGFCKLAFGHYEECGEEDLNSTAVHRRQTKPQWGFA